MALTTPLEAIVSGSYRLPDTGNAFSCPIKALEIASDLSGQENELIAALGIGGRLAIVCDVNTFDALGKRLSRSLRQADLVVLDTPKADVVDALALADRTRHADTLVAVGAGTLNDLCKYVSHRRNRPYVVFPTAPSMNGYTTATASISRDGEKLSLPAMPPKAAFFDLGVLAKAPARLIRAGVGDSLCRSTAQVDWLISHRLLGTPYLRAPFDLQQSAEQALVTLAEKLLHGDHEAMQALVQLLVLGGLGMLIAGNSQPGSQGEHLISHYIDMLCCPHPGTLHGEQVGLATWTMARLQNDILNNVPPPILSKTTVDTRSMRQRYGPLSASFEKAMETKALHGHRLDVLNNDLEQHWSALRKELDTITMPTNILGAVFDAVGVAKDPVSLGIDPDFYNEAFLHARELRDRFTTLDLAGDAGLLDGFIETHLHRTHF